MNKIWGTVAIAFMFGIGVGMVIASAIMETRRADEHERINEMSRHYLECVDEVKALGGGDDWKRVER